MKTQIKITNRGLKSVATRAANSFTTGRDNSANAYLDGATVHVSTRAAGGDNVPWAKSLLNRVSARLQARYGLTPDYSSEQHCCGNCSIKLNLPVS